MDETSSMSAHQVLVSLVSVSPRGTQARIARDLGVSAQTVSGWLTGGLAIHPRWFLPLADVLGLADRWALVRADGAWDTLGLEPLDEMQRAERWSSYAEPGPARQDATLERIEALERRVADLEQQLEHLLTHEATSGRG